MPADRPVYRGSYTVKKDFVRDKTWHDIFYYGTCSESSEQVFRQSQIVNIKSSFSVNIPVFESNNMDAGILR